MSKIDSRNRSEVGRMARDDGAESTRPLRRPPTIRIASRLPRRPAGAAATFRRSLAGRPGGTPRRGARPRRSVPAVPFAAMAARPVSLARPFAPIGRAVETARRRSAVARPGARLARLEFGARSAVSRVRARRSALAAAVMLLALRPVEGALARAVRLTLAFVPIRGRSKRRAAERRRALEHAFRAT